MDSANQHACPHCGADFAAGATFCAHCGKALPTGRAPRIVPEKSFAETSAGRAIQAAYLHKISGKCAQALMIAAVIQTLFGLFILVVSMASMSPTDTLNKPFFLVIFGVAVVFYALYFWARKSPAPAAIVGLVFFLTLHALDAIVDPASLARGFILKILIVSLLIYGIRAGLRHKRLLAEMGQA